MSQFGLNTPWKGIPYKASLWPAATLPSPLTVTDPKFGSVVSVAAPTTPPSTGYTMWTSSLAFKAPVTKDKSTTTTPPANPNVADQGEKELPPPPDVPGAVNGVSTVVSQVKPGSSTFVGGLWNPPMHRASKGSGATLYRKYLNEYGTGQQQSDATVAAGFKALDALENNNIGYMFQDPDFKQSTAGSTLWGFQFHYNPTVINETYTNDPSIDWTAQDKAAPLSGTGTITLELYLNRIVDLAAFAQPGASSRSYNLSAVSANYARPLGDEHLRGLLNRGTNYDIEYLFRIVNGDPVSGSPQFDSNLPTSNFGYMTGVPFWVVLGKNMRYKVSLTSLDIRHAMFTPDMIPTLTTINLTLARYPVIYADSAKTESRYNAAKTYLGQTGTKTPDTPADPAKD